MTGNPHSRETATTESRTMNQIWRVRERTSSLRYYAELPGAAAQRLSCVLGMLSS